MSTYIVCRNCEFVLLGEESTEAVPRRVDSCPGCSGTDFEFTDGEPAADD